MNSALGPDLDALIAHGPLEVAFQPIVSLETNEIFGFEVLGRCGRVDGPLAEFAERPDRLLAAAHRCGRMLALDRKWRELAITKIASRDDGRSSYFINVDPRVAADPEFAPGFTLALVRSHGLAPERFVLELSEIGDTPSAVEHVLAHYAAQGFRVAIDDLGAGERSLALLLRLHPNFIKLDSSLIRDLSSDSNRRELVRAIAGFGLRTGARLVAEAIETEAELVSVREAGVQYGQGFLLGRPGELQAQAQGRSSDRRLELPRSATADDPVPALLRLIDRMQARGDLGVALQHVIEFTQELLGTERVSLRLLDETRSRLLVAARSGPAAPDAHSEFKVGEGLIGWIVARSEPLRLGLAETDPRFAVRPERIPVVSFVGVPLVDAEGCFGVLSASSPAIDRFSTEDVDRLRLIAGVVGPHLQIGRLRRLARTDALTCFLNRRALDEVLPDQAPDEVVSVVMLDLDHFKQINDKFGHGAGDDVLRRAAGAIASVLRQLDCVVRLGGDEFLLVLPGVPVDIAELIGERAKSRVSEVTASGDHRVTASIGVAQRGAGETRSQLFERVDAALYRAKRDRP